MLRHACGFKLANDGHDTRAIQEWIGHQNIQHTTRYTELTAKRFKPQLPVSPRSHTQAAHLEPLGSGGDGTPNRTQTGSQYARATKISSTPCAPVKMHARKFFG
jgi:hypothetical protein